MLFEGYTEQDLPFECPECDTKLGWESVVGTGDYPLHGYRANLKPLGRQAMGFECPKCFAKSVMHTRNTMIKLWEDWKREQREKGGISVNQNASH